MTRAKAKPKAAPKARPKRGRPTKLTAATRDIIVAAIRANATPEEAAQLAGIGRTTYWKWRRDNETFRNTVERVTAEAEARLVATITASAVGRAAQRDSVGNVTRREVAADADDAKWLLTHHPVYRKRWGDRVTIDYDVLAQQIADETGLEKEDILAEAESIVKDAQGH